MERRARLIGSLLVLGVAMVAAQKQPEVTTRFGPVRGTWFRTLRKNDVAGFLGLPYADPPLGELRFENPRLWTKKWTEVRNATTDGPMCMQKIAANVVGSEDCLYLNVFTPSITKNGNATSQKNLPVLVFIHGGSFKSGSSNSQLYAPTYLLDQQIILVTMNYRLGILGFFSSGNAVAPGNYGLKDITAALFWVRDNIAAFGGNPGSVTLMGQSSGAGSAQILAASKATEGLFHKLITMSGSATAPWTVQTNESIRNASLHVATLVGCLKNQTNNATNNVTTLTHPVTGTTFTNTSFTNTAIANTTFTNTTTPVSNLDKVNSNTTTTKIANVTKITDQQIKECLKNADAADVINYAFYDVWRGNPVCIFGPTLEAEAEGAVLTVHPAQSLRKGLFRDMPWITGVTADEGLIKTTDLFLDSGMKKEFLQNYKEILVPYVLEMEHVIDNVTAATEAIVDFYFKGDVPANLEANVTQLIGDGALVWHSFDILEKLSSKMKSNVYFYLFAYEGTFSNTFRMNTPYHFGVAHSDDVNYFFPILNNIYKDLQLENTMGDQTMINIMTEMWANFVKTGVPSAWLTETWEPYRKARQFMRFGDGQSSNHSLEANFLPERMAFWKQLMSNYSTPFGRGEGSGKGAASSRFSPVGHLLCLCVALLLLQRRFF